MNIANVGLQSHFVSKTSFLTAIAQQTDRTLVAEPHTDVLAAWKEEFISINFFHLHSDVNFNDALQMSFRGGEKSINIFYIFLSLPINGRGLEEGFKELV